MIFSQDSSVYDEVSLVHIEGEYRIEIPFRTVVTNRSGRNHPLQAMYYISNDKTQHINEIVDKQKNSQIIPLNLPPNESRVLSFDLFLPLAKKHGEYLSGVLGPATREGVEWSMGRRIDLTSLYTKLEDTNIGAELLSLSGKGVLHYQFATTREGNPYLVDERVNLP